MTNISEDRRVVLTALREVPEEITFMLSDAEQDPKIPNRYWFDFPAQWANQQNKDPIIGIRDMYLTKTNRFVCFTYTIELYSGVDVSAPSTETSTLQDKAFGMFAYDLEGNETVADMVKKFNEIWLSKATREEHTCTDEQHTWNSSELYAFLNYDDDTQRLVLTIFTPKTFRVGNDVWYYHASITLLTSDTLRIFGLDESVNNTIAFWDEHDFPVWSRQQCLVKSSLATNDKNNILGHTRNDSYNPIKYYRLNNGLKKFWIELYETRYHDSPVSLPAKVNADGKKELDRDDLFIEAIVCFTAQAMI